ncbi:TonB-dependent receptor [Sphingomonas solaris]|nr:TonB-dependent receptor [Sphingomonas solaris]
MMKDREHMRLGRILMMFPGSVRRHSLLAFTALTTFGASLATAQTPVTPPAGGTGDVGSVPAPPAVISSGPLASAAANDTAGDIIVTAQRRVERLENVPLSITALPAATLSQAGITRFQDLGNISAGVQVSRGGAFTQPSIRGVTTLTTGVGYENNVAVYIDGFYQPDTVGINGDLVNVTDVQILKGPQGTLYGRNATGGAILVNTAAPSDTFTGSVNLSYARFDDKRAQLYLSGPITQGVNFSVAGYTRKSDGYIRDLDATGKKDFNAAPVKNTAIRTKLQLKPFDGVTLTAGYNHVYLLDARGLVFTVFDNSPASIDALPGRARDRNTASANFAPKNALKLDEGTLKAEITTGIGKLSSYTSYADRTIGIRFDFDASKLPISRTDQNARQKTFQQSVDYSIDAIDNVDLVIGGLYYHDKFRSNFVPTTNGVRGVQQFINTRGTAAAAYIDATYNITPNLFLTGGARYSYERKHLDYNVIPVAALLPVDTAASFSSVTPRFVARYELADRTNVYASYTQGFRSGTFPLTAQVRPALALPVRPEKIDAYEIGFKTADRGLRFETAAFYYDYRNLQVGLTVPDPTCTPGAPCGIVNLIGNARRAESYGGEASLSVTPVQDLNLRGSVAYTHARYTDFATATGTGLNATTQQNVPGQVQNWNGQQAARAPTWTANLGGDYTVPVAEGRLTFSANAAYTSSFVISNPSLFGALAAPVQVGKQRFRQGAYGLLNGSATWVGASGLSFGVYSDNITNTKYKVVSSGGAFGSYRQYGEPVTYGVRAGYKF